MGSTRHNIVKAVDSAHAHPRVPDPLPGMKTDPKRWVSGIVKTRHRKYSGGCQGLGERAMGVIV